MHLAKQFFVRTIAAGFLLLLNACTAPETPSPTPTPTPGITLTPFASPTASPAVTASPRPVASPTPPPTPTATPFIYKIASGDTLFAIAFRFGTTLEEILSVNPGIDPQFLVVGGDLVIPMPENPGTAGALPTPSGAVVALGTPVCFPVEDESLWCFASYANEGAEAVENLAAQISVYDRDGELLDTRIAIAPVNILPAGRSAPVVAWFAGIGPAYDQATARLSSAIPVNEDDPRYAAAALDFEVDLEGEFASVTGRITGVFSEARLGIVAYDAEGRVIGVRVLLLEGDPAGENSLAFSTDVFSLGGNIDSVDVLAEAYP